jgi:hypothetical protein
MVQKSVKYKWINIKGEWGHHLVNSYNLTLNLMQTILASSPYLQPYPPSINSISTTCNGTQPK